MESLRRTSVRELWVFLTLTMKNRPIYAFGSQARYVWHRNVGRVILALRELNLLIYAFDLQVRYHCHQTVNRVILVWQELNLILGFDMLQSLQDVVYLDLMNVWIEIFVSNDILHDFKPSHHRINVLDMLEVRVEFGVELFSKLINHHANVVQLFPHAPNHATHRI